MSIWSCKKLEFSSVESEDGGGSTAVLAASRTAAVPSSSLDSERQVQNLDADLGGQRRPDIQPFVMSPWIGSDQEKGVRKKACRLFTALDRTPEGVGGGGGGCYLYWYMGNLIPGTQSSHLSEAHGASRGIASMNLPIGYTR